MMNKKEQYMLRCIQLAKKGKLYASPNPLVGAVIVYEDRIIGEGYHIKSGTNHAEVNAINSVKDKNLLTKATIYVSLEPCAHTGKTPPCADLIIKSQIPHVVIGCQDPFSKVNGLGIQKMKDAGIEVEVGVLEAECKELIHRFCHFHLFRKPYVILKWAQSADGYIDIKRVSGTPVVFSTPYSSIMTHKRRAEVDAILVGKNTALLDNPRLNVRGWYPKHPLRVVVDRSLSLPKSLHLFDQSFPTMVFNKKVTKSEENLMFKKLGEGNDSIDISLLLDELYKDNIQSVLVEGGAKVLNTFIESNLWNEIHIELSKKVLGDGVKAPTIPLNASFETSEFFGQTFFSLKNTAY